MQEVKVSIRGQEHLVEPLRESVYMRFVPVLGKSRSSIEDEVVAYAINQAIPTLSLVRHEIILKGEQTTISFNIRLEEEEVIACGGRMMQAYAERQIEKIKAKTNGSTVTESQKIVANQKIKGLQELIDVITTELDKLDSAMLEDNEFTDKLTGKIQEAVNTIEITAEEALEAPQETPETSIEIAELERKLAQLKAVA